NEPPAISLSASQIPVGQQLTVTGTSFFTSELSVSLAQGAQNTVLQSVTPDANGRFTYTLPIDASYASASSFTLVAESSPENGAPSALRATAVFSVMPAGTAAAGAPNTTPGAGALPPPSRSGSSLGAIIVLIVGIILTLLAIVGALAYLVIRHRAAHPRFPPLVLCPPP